MKLNTDFEIVDIAGEFMAVPVGKMRTSFHGVIALSEPAAFMLQFMQQHRTVHELVELITEEYDVDYVVAENDVTSVVSEMIRMGLLKE